MKKFFAFLGWLLLIGVVTTCATFVIMKHIHKNTYKQEAIEWVPALEKVLDKEKVSKDEDIVVEDETQEDNSEDLIEEPINEDEISSGETDPIEDETQTE